MAKILGIIDENIVFEEECNYNELESFCTNLIIEYGNNIEIKMYDEYGTQIFGNEDWL